MRLESLRVLHLPKAGIHEAGAIALKVRSALPGIFLLDSCQRYLWICSQDELCGVSLPEELSVLTGWEAYSLLLRVTCGLESQIAGETDIFGQFKEAWRVSELGAELRAELNPWVQRVFEDTKEVRSQYLQNLGGGSYGTLVRKLIREWAAAPWDPILIVGAGQIARAVAPYLLDHEIWLQNRTVESARELKAEIERLNPKARVRVLITPEEEKEGWTRAAHGVICIPFSAESDALRIQQWKEGLESAPTRSLIHLGGMASEAGAWAELPQFRCLDHLFALEKTQGELRSLQIAQARKACEQKSKLRSLGASVSIPHGWEDLAVFA